MKPIDRFHFRSFFDPIHGRQGYSIHSGIFDFISSFSGDPCSAGSILSISNAKRNIFLFNKGLQILRKKFSGLPTMSPRTRIFIFLKNQFACREAICREQETQGRPSHLHSGLQPIPHEARKAHLLSLIM